MKKNKISKGLLLMIILMTILVLPSGVKAESFTVSSESGTKDPFAKRITNKADLTINGVMDNDVLKAFSISNIFYNTKTNTVSYEASSDFKRYLDTNEEFKGITDEELNKLIVGDFDSLSQDTKDLLPSIVSGYISYIKVNNIVGTELKKDGNNRSSSLEVGVYLIIPTTTNSVYSIMIAPLDVGVDDVTKEWKINSVTIDAKSSNPAVVSKKIVGITDDKASFFIDNNYSYEITTTVPQYPIDATNKKYLITDVVSEGITIDDIVNFEVVDGITKLTINNDGNILDQNNNIVGLIKIIDNIITFDFNLNYVTSDTIKITYNAKLNDNAIIGNAGNETITKLTYSNDPYSDSTIDTEEIIISAYTYGIQALVYDKKDKDKRLANSVFEIYSDYTLTTKVGELTSDSDGFIKISGLPSGTYYLKQIKSSDGYILLNDLIEIKVAIDGASESENLSGYYYTEIASTKKSLLPFTGGSGVYSYVIFGLLLIVLATIVYIIYRKEQEKRLESNV